MDAGLLQSLAAGAGSRSQFIGGLVVALLYAVIGVLGAIGSIVVFRRVFHGRREQMFWATFLVVIAGFYLSFAACFAASHEAYGIFCSTYDLVVACHLMMNSRGWREPGRFDP